MCVCGGGGDVERWRKRGEVMTFALANINLIHLVRQEASL